LSLSPVDFKRHKLEARRKEETEREREEEREKQQKAPARARICDERERLFSSLFSLEIITTRIDFESL